MRNNLIRKGLVVGMIVLFIGVNLASSTSNNAEKINNAGTCDLEIFNPIDDTEVSHILPDTILGDYPGMVIRNEYGSGGSTGWAEDGLLKFDISSIPAEASVESASLYVFYHSWGSTDPQGRELNLYRITSEWDEETATWNNQPTYYTNPSTSAFVPEDIHTWIQWNVTSDVQEFVSGQLNNYGWKITDENYWGGSDIPMTRLRSKENITYIPYLEINYVLPNQPPEKPNIDGPTSGKPNIAYQWNFTSVDPNGDNIHYYVDWGDGTNTGWSLAYTSGQTMPKSHEYSAKGTYTISAKTMDIYGLESDWTTLPVTMPVDIIVGYQPFQQILSFQVKKIMS